MADGLPKKTEAVTDRPASTVSTFSGQSSVSQRSTQPPGESASRASSAPQSHRTQSRTSLVSRRSASSTASASQKSVRSQSAASGSGRSLTQHSESRSVVDGTLSDEKLTSEGADAKTSESPIVSKTESPVIAQKSAESITGRPASKAESSTSAAKDFEEMQDGEGDERQTAASSSTSSYVS